MKINSINLGRAYAPIQELAIMINNANNSINRPIDRIIRTYWLLLAIIAIKCNDFIIIYNHEINHSNVHCCDY
jgi:hypothetical protein